MDTNPSGFYVVNSEGEQVPISRLEITLHYQLKTVMVPFKFCQYVDEGTGKEIYSSALAPVNAGEIQGNILLHKVEGEYIEVLFVPRQTLSVTKGTQT